MVQCLLLSISSAVVGSLLALVGLTVSLLAQNCKCLRDEVLQKLYSAPERNLSGAPRCIRLNQSIINTTWATGTDNSDIS